MTDVIINANHAERFNIQLVGGKAYNLAHLQLAGCKVPLWFTLNAKIFAELMATTLPKTIQPNQGEAIQQSILNFTFPESIQQQITQAINKIKTENEYVAVRSSAIDEDNAACSFAGLHDSFLFMQKHDDIIVAIKKVWASLFNARALSYRQQNNISLDNITIAVVIQKMIMPKTSGVIFSVNPANLNVNEVFISALYGAGEGLVSQGLDADNFIINKNTFTIEPTIAHKVKQFILDRQKSFGLIDEQVQEELQTKPCLQDDLIIKLTQFTKEIECYYRMPQDIEFAIDEDNNIYFLQARPITTIEELGPAAGHYLLWDNSNIIESYSGVTTPMTFSFIKHAYHIVYLCFSEVMGIHSKVIKQNQATFANMLGLIRGRVYYNINNWYKLVKLFPGFQFNKGFMESMMGVKESAVIDDSAEKVSVMRRYFIEAPKLIKLLSKTLFNFIFLKRKANKFNQNFNHYYDIWSNMDFHQQSPHELMLVYQQMETHLLWQWKAPIINDFFVMIFYGVLKKLCHKWCQDDNASLQNDLLSGEGDIESTLPAKMLITLANDANLNPTLKSIILNKPLEQVLPTILDNEQFESFNTQFKRYLHLYGFRCVDELKLESSTLRDKPQFIIQMIKNYLNTDNPSLLDLSAITKREKLIRNNAEKKAFEAINKLKFKRCKNFIFTRVVQAARFGVKNRENMRFARTKIYGLLRELLRAIGDDFAVKNIISKRDDIFYLSIDEVWDFIKGTAITLELKPLIALRRQEFATYLDDQTPPNDRFATYGLVYYKNLFKTQTKIVKHEDGLLYGIPCCPGKITGKIKIIRSPVEDAELNGEILVAERTDPGWVPLYPAISGLLIERGSILSHSAIVAREMGIPTIVGITDLIKQLRDGQTVTLDGAAGTVEINE